MNGQDDLDELLDEIEKTHIPHLAKSKLTKSSNSSYSKSITSDIDNMIDDLLSEDYKGTSDNHKIKEDQLSWQQVSSDNNKCYPVLLGGSTIEMGHSHSSDLKACDTLRCTSCDFRVIWFNDYFWHSSCDYLFFRNNVPDNDKLKVKLIRSKGNRAYACQCSWQSVKDTLSISDISGLKWVCAKHNI